MHGCRTYEPAAKQFDDRIGKLNFSSVRRINLMYNKMEQQFDKLEFVGDTGKILATLTFKAPIVTPYLPGSTNNYLSANLWGGLDFLSNFLGH